jgi:hypothetical protein
MHISSSGKIELHMSTIVSTLAGNEEVATPGPWIRVRSGMARLNASAFQASAPGQDLLRLVGSAASEAEIRGCQVENLNVSRIAGRPVGIVNSTFSPALTPFTAAVRCGVQVFEQKLCDPRAICVEQTSGGIRCSCDGLHLRNKAGSFPDGQHCFEEAHAEFTIQSRVASVALTKPSYNFSTDDPAVIILQARGEDSFNASYRIEAHLFRSSMLIHSTNQTTNRSEFYFYGQSLRWTLPPSNPSKDNPDIVLGPSVGFQATKSGNVTVNMDCYGTGGCAEDGDIILTTVFFVPSASAPASVSRSLKVSSIHHRCNPTFLAGAHRQPCRYLYAPKCGAFRAAVPNGTLRFRMEHAFRAGTTE